MQYQAWQQPPMYPLMLPEAMKPPEKDVEIVYQPQLYTAGEAAVAAAASYWYCEGEVEAEDAPEEDEVSPVVLPPAATAATTAATTFTAVPFHPQHHPQLHYEGAESEEIVI